MKANLYTFAITFGLALYPKVLGGRSCQWSNETAEAVSSCPQNRSEMEERAKIKNCEKIAKIQNCTVFEKFKYHCVINELETTFVEVCAPQYYVHRYCTEYNSLGAVIQEHFSLKCSEVKPSCNSSYLSTEAYLYKGCYKIVRKNTEMSSTDIPTYHVKQTITVNPLRNNKSDNRDTTLQMPILFGTAAVFILLVCLCLVVLFIRWRIGKLVRNEASSSEEQLIHQGYRGQCTL